MIKQHSVISIMALGMLLVFSAENCVAQDYSSLVYPRSDGKLVYRPYANEGQDNAVNIIPDFSTAGYKGGGVRIPCVPIRRCLSPSSGDDAARIQAAIDELAALPLDAEGFRGAILLSKGDYEVNRTIRITASGIVLRGEGQNRSGGTRITYAARKQSNLIEIHGESGLTEAWNTRTQITDAYVPSGATSFHVISTAGFTVGDLIVVHRQTNQKWIDDLKMTRFGWKPSYYEDRWERTVTAVDGDRITIGAPTVQAIQMEYGGGCIYKVAVEGRISNVGVEALYIESTYFDDVDEDHGSYAIEMKHVENAWVRQVTARFFVQGCVSVGKDSKFVTVQDCAALDHKSLITGERRYSFYMDDCSFVLIQRCFCREGRHDYVQGSRVLGPNVFLDCLAVSTHSDCGPHHRYSEGTLWDNIKADSINVQNRKDSGTGHGWAGAQQVLWNCVADSIICDAPVGAMNFAIGCKASKKEGLWAPEEPFGIWESHGNHVIPRSIYLKQLEDRLGTNAVTEVAIEAQLKGPIWNDLHAWAGEGRMNGVAPITHRFTGQSVTNMTDTQIKATSQTITTTKISSGHVIATAILIAAIALAVLMVKKFLTREVG